MDCEKENIRDGVVPEPVKKKPRLSLSLRLKSSTDVEKERFAIVSSEEMNTICKGYVPANTEKNTKWSVKCFKEWIFCRNRVCNENEKCPDDLLETQNPVVLNNWIPRFVAEVRRSDGKKYPPKTIHLILSGILRFMRSVSDDAPNILDKKDTRFKSIKNACDVVYRGLHKEGVGASVQHAPIITTEEEQKLWDMNILNTDTPVGLQKAVFFYVGKLCCLRGGEEHRGLKISQFTQKDTDPPYYVYTEHGSKNRSGGLAQLNLENKEVIVCGVPENAPRCLVFLLDLYLSKLPLKAFELDYFYLRPKRKSPGQPTEAWYDEVPVGKNKLSTFLKDMFSDAGLETKTNHSLRATGATALFNAGVPEKVIQNTTGHRSVEALRKYEKVSIEQSVEACKVLTTLDGNLSVDHFNQTARNQTSPSTSDAGWLGFQGCSVGAVTININK